MEAPRKRAVIYDIASDLSKAYAVIFSPKPYGFDSLTAKRRKKARKKEINQKTKDRERFSFSVLFRARALAAFIRCRSLLPHPRKWRGTREGEALEL